MVATARRNRKAGAVARGVLRITKDIAMAAAMDAGNRSKKAAGRAAWNTHDRNVAAMEYNRLYPVAQEQAEALAAFLAYREKSA